MEENTTITHGFIRGLIVGEGCFSFYTVGKPDLLGHKQKTPAFIISLSKQDYELMYLIKNKLKLRNKIYEYQRKPTENRFNRQPMMVLVIRDIGQLKNIIVPLCHRKLAGHKAKQFKKWLGEILTDPYVPERYKILPKLAVEGGFYDKNPKFLD